MLSVIPISRPGFIFLFRERLCFIITSGAFSSYSALTFCPMKRRCFVIWLTTYVFTLLLVDLFFDSYVVTSVTALILNFLPFAFIYTFAGYRYPMATALAVVSLYFLHLGFRNRLSFLPFAGRDCGRALFGELDIRQAISVGACDCRTAVRCILLEDVKAKRHVDLARLGYLWLCGGCHADSALYRLQSRMLTLYMSPALFAISGTQCNQGRFRLVSGRTPSSFGTAFSPCRVLAFLSRIPYLFRCHIIGCWYLALYSRSGKSTLKFHC